MTQYVYAGAAPWSGVSDTMQPGGLFRQKAGTRILSASMNIAGCPGGSRPN